MAKIEQNLALDDSMESGQLAFQKVAVEKFELKDEKPFDIAFAVRVGALDGRHPEIAEQAIARIQAALKPKGRFFIDGGDPLKEIILVKRKPPGPRKSSR